MCPVNADIPTIQVIFVDEPDDSIRLASGAREIKRRRSGAMRQRSTTRAGKRVLDLPIIRSIN